MNEFSKFYEIFFKLLGMKSHKHQQFSSNPILSINFECLVKKHGYSKLTLKINLIKIKCYDMFFTQPKFQQLTSSVLSTVGLKGTNAPNVMSVLADQNSKKGDHDKASQYIGREKQDDGLKLKYVNPRGYDKFVNFGRALSLANEVLDGIKVHKKYIGIFAAKSQIEQRKKKNTEALATLADLEKMMFDVYGDQNTYLKSTIHLRKAQIYTEMKGEEYKAEDHLKEYQKLSEKVYQDLTLSKDQSCLNFQFQLELMSGFLKIQRPDKVQKIYKDITKALEEKDQVISVAKITVELLSLQAEQDPTTIEGRLAEIQTLTKDVEEKIGQPTIISLYLKQFQISVLFQQLSDFEQAQIMTQDLIQENLVYFEGNEISETLVDPYMIAASIHLQLNQIQEAAMYLQKAENIIKALNGDINEKMLEVYTIQIQIGMIQQRQLPEIFDLVQKRTALALNIFGLESEQYTTFLEEEILLRKDSGQFQQALPMLEKLIRALKDINGGENSQRILQCYDHLFQMQYKCGMYTDALLIVQKKVSIYKALNGNDAVDAQFTTYVVEMGLINFALRKFDDAIENWKEAEKLVKKLPASDDPKGQEAQIQKFISQAIKEKSGSEKVVAGKERKTLLQLIKPDSTPKMLAWAAVFAGAAGFVAYTILKKKQ